MCQSGIFGQIKVKNKLHTQNKVRIPLIDKNIDFNTLTDKKTQYLMYQISLRMSSLENDSIYIYI